jgi:hypothetical protein
MDRDIVVNLSNQVSSSGILFLLLLGSSSGLPAGVEVYRCTLNGETEFRQTPCPEGEQQLTEVVQQSSGMTPVQPALRLQRKAPAKKKTPKIIEKSETRGDRERCWKFHKKLDRVERRLRAGYKASQYQQLHDRQQEYEDYLRLFCP